MLYMCFFIILEIGCEISNDTVSIETMRYVPIGSDLHIFKLDICLQTINFGVANES